MKKVKAKLPIIAILALILLLITGYTFSRLNQSHRGRISMTPAKWFFNVTTNNGASISEIALTTSDGQPLLPGTSGSFEINLDATGSAMPIAYHAKVTDENFPDDMLFYMQDRPMQKYKKVNGLLDAFFEGTLSANEGQTKTYTVCWEWPLDGNDVIDTSNMNYGFNLEVIGEQI